MKTHIHLTAPRAYRSSPPSDSAPERPRIALYLSLALAFLAHPVFAQGWYTVDDFQYSTGKTAYATGLAKDPSGTIIYSAGGAVDASGVRHHLVFASVDSGTNWSVSDDYTGAADSISIDGDPSIACDPSGNLYASDVGIVNGSTAWLVRSLPAGGSTWVTVGLLANGNGIPYGLATDSAGNVFAVGVSTGASSNEVWTVRKGTPTGSGISWANVDAFTSPYGSCEPSGVLCHPTAGVFVVGTSLVNNNAYPSGLWTVRRSQDGGATWATVDTFQLPSLGRFGNLASAASSVGADAAGNVYVVGNAWQTSQKHVTSGPYWIVRKCVNPGASSPAWSIVDNFQLSPTYNAYASAFASDTRTNLFVTGAALSSGGWQWVVRESVAGAGTWNTVDTFQYGIKPFVNAALGDGLGNVFVAGTGHSANGGGVHWLVRKN